ncbi:MAG: CPBP family intramembrane metalloprotease [bacterium]|nr:CPBP family intramembrane metalloprotease [bacterium]
MEKNPSYPKIGNAILLLLLIGGIQLLVAFHLGILTFIFGEDFFNKYDNLFTAAINIIAMGTIIFIGLKKTGLPFKELYPVKKISFLLFLSITITIAGMCICLSEIDNLFKFVFPMPEFLSQLFLKLFLGKNLISAIFLLVIVAPFTEEFVFRGLFLNGFLKNYSVRKAILISALLFGIIHLNPWQFISAFLGGIYLGWLFVNTRSLVPGLLAHAVMNGLPYFLFHFLPVKIKGFTDFSVTPTLQPAWLDGLGAALLLTGLISTWMLFKNEKDKKEDEEENKDVDTQVLQENLL